MKKILALFAILLLVGNLSAQRLGVQGGYSLSTPSIGTEDNAVNFNPQSGSGFHVGALFDWDMTNRWGFEASVLYNMRTMRFNMEYQSDTSTIFRREVFYLDIPIHFIVHFPVRKTRISLFLGPSFNIGLHGKDVAWLDLPTERPVSLEKEVFGDEQPLQRFDLSAELGMAVEYKQLQFRASYEVSVLNTAYSDYGYTFSLPTTSVPYFYQGVFKFSVAYMFDLTK